MVALFDPNTITPMSDTNKIKDGGPAFPCEHMVIDTSLERHAMRKALASGLSMRDYFAAKAMQSMVSNGASLGSDQRTAEVSYRIADAMIAAREPK